MEIMGFVLTALFLSAVWLGLHMFDPDHLRVRRDSRRSKTINAKVPALPSMPLTTRPIGVSEADSSSNLRAVGE